MVIYFVYRSVELSLKHNFYQSHFSVAKISMTIPPDFLSESGFILLVFTDFVTRAVGLLPLACSEPAGGTGHEDRSGLDRRRPSPPASGKPLGVACLLRGLLLPVGSSHPLTA